MPKSVLVADDSLTIRKVIGMLLTSHEDFSLTMVDNGLDALARVRDLRPDLVLADCMMPGKSGYEVCETIKNDPSTAHIPVMLLAGTFEPFDEGRARAARADGHISKPFDSTSFLDKVKGLVGIATGSAMPSTVGPVSTAPVTPTARPVGAPAGMPGAPGGFQQPRPMPGMAGAPGMAPRPMGAIPAGTQPSVPRPPGPGMPGAPGMPPGGMARPGMPPGGMARPGMPPGPGMARPGMPPGPGMGRPGMPGAPGMPPRPMGVPGMPGTMPPGPGMARPGMPPQGFPRPPGAPGLPGVGAPPRRDPFGLGAPGAPPHATESLRLDGDGGEAVLRDALSKASKEVIEKIAWEVVPQLAEAIIREELERLIKEREARGIA